MPSFAYIYQEPMNEPELTFLMEKEQRERRIFLRTVRNLSVLFIVAPCCLGIFMEFITRSDLSPAMKAVREREEPYTYLMYFLGMIVLLTLLGMASAYTYRRTLGRLMKDIRSGMKTVEQTRVDRKLHMESNGTYHFYLKSTFKLSVEVSREDFEAYEDGDEINIEYSTYSRVYFGYF